MKLLKKPVSVLENVQKMRLTVPLGHGGPWEILSKDEVEAGLTDHLRGKVTTHRTYSERKETKFTFYAQINPI